MAGWQHNSAVLLVLGLGIFCFIAPAIVAYLPQILGEKALKAPILAEPIHRDIRLISAAQFLS